MSNNSTLKSPFQTLVLILMFGFVTVNSFGQGESNFWYFGYNAGLDFTGGAPVAITNGQLHTDEGCASVSDASGNLLFYTDGISVYNKNHTLMPNGFGLLGNPSSSQSGVIIQKPSSTNIYYIFTVAAFSSGGINYSEVDLSLNGGLGDITSNKNILLHNLSCEKITGVRHCNNNDIWVVSHDFGTNTFRTFSVTASGVNTTPVLSSIGSVMAGSGYAGCLKASPNGKKIASAVYLPSGQFELFDFNNTTGVISNAIAFPVVASTNGPYGVEFSPDGTKLYGSLVLPSVTGNNIYQFDLCAGSNIAIAASGVLIGSSTDYPQTMQLGPDGKIYVALGGPTYLGVINSPNSLGTSSNYINNGVSLSGKQVTSGLPNFVPFYFKPTPPPFTETDTCLTASFTKPTVNITNCSVSSNAIDSLVWNFGDPASGLNDSSTFNNPSHTYPISGAYTVTLILYYACGSDTLIQNVTVSSVGCVFSTTASSTNILCSGQCTGTASTFPTSGISPYTYSWNTNPIQTTQTAIGLCAGTYTVTITDAANNTVTTTVTIVVLNSGPTATVSPNVSIILGNTTTLIAGGGGAYNWILPTGLSCTNCSSPIASPLVSTTYCVEVVDTAGCKDTACVTITVDEMPCPNFKDIEIPNVFSPNRDGKNDVFYLEGWDLCTETFEMVIYNRWGIKIFESTNTNVEWDGRILSGKEATAGTYYYIFTIKNVNGNDEKIAGFITLLR